MRGVGKVKVPNSEVDVMLWLLTIDKREDEGTDGQTGGHIRTYANFLTKYYVYLFIYAYSIPMMLLIKQIMYF